MVKLLFDRIRRLHKLPVLARPKAAIGKHRYSTPLFMLRETLAAFQKHNGFSISASLAFYALFALIPMALLTFFLLSHLVISSDYAIVRLAILASNLLPEFSQRIMVEVFKISRHKAVWGAFGMFALFWAAIPLAGALRTSFYTISSVVEVPSFIRRTFKDAIAVLGILLLLFLFTFGGVMLEKSITFLRPHFVSAGLLNGLSSFFLSTLVIAAFYHAFFPAKVLFRHILLGSILTVGLWMAVRPAFGLFLFLHQSYGTIFGGMKNMFISIGWLYYSFAAFLLGTELIAALRKKDVLLLKELFTDAPHQSGYLDNLMGHFGKNFERGDYVCREGEHGHEMYYIVSGVVTLYRNGMTLHEVHAGDYFGEMAVLADTPRAADCMVTSEHAQILSISAENIETLLMEEPKIAMTFLREMALRLRHASGLLSNRQ
jgi:membrane protein